MSSRAFQEAAENLLCGRNRPVPIHRQVKRRQYTQGPRGLVVNGVPSPVHVRRWSGAHQRRNRLLRYQDAGDDGGNEAGVKTQVNNVVDEVADGPRKEEAAALRSDPTPGEQQVSKNHTHDGDPEPLVYHESGEGNNR